MVSAISSRGYFILYMFQKMKRIHMRFLEGGASHDNDAGASFPLPGMSLPNPGMSLPNPGMSLPYGASPSPARTLSPSLTPTGSNTYSDEAAVHCVDRDSTASTQILSMPTVSLIQHTCLVSLICFLALDVCTSVESGAYCTVVEVMLTVYRANRASSSVAVQQVYDDVLVKQLEAGTYANDDILAIRIHPSQNNPVNSSAVVRDDNQQSPTDGNHDSSTGRTILVSVMIVVGVALMMLVVGLVLYHKRIASQRAGTQLRCFWWRG